MSRDVVVLLSGGLDSSLVAAIAAEDGRLLSTVFVDYGQPALSQEWRAACLIAAHLKTECCRFVCSGEIEMGDTMRIGVGIAGARVVPGRNALLLSCAVSWAVKCGAREVRYGATADDAQEYPDCRPAFVKAFGAMSSTTYGVTISAPLITLFKGHIFRWAHKISLPIESTWSCYEPLEGQPCGTCNSCRLRELGQRGLDRRVEEDSK